MSIFGSLGGQAQQPQGGPQNMLQALRQFAATLQGDPRQQVQQLINSGQVSQAQLNQAMAMAQQLQQMLRR